MSCGGNSTFNIQPFGHLRGPYRCTERGCNWSGTALADLRRNGFTDQFVDWISTDGGFNPGSSGSIRPAIPRDITINSTGEVLSPEAIQDITDQINELQQRRAEILATIGQAPEGTLGFMTGVVDETRQFKIDGINAQIAELRATAYTINGLDIVADSDNAGISDNVLNCYTDVQYHVSLTMISQAEAIRFQTGEFNTVTRVDLNTMKTDKRADNSITLASTGDTLSNREFTTYGGIEDHPDIPRSTGTSTRNYYNIVSLTVQNILEPSPSNPLISTMLSMKMRVAEPHGFKLHEDIRDTALSLGYHNVNPGRFLYRVDIYFSGYNQDTGEWIEQIAINPKSGNTVVSAVMGISAMEAEITSSGTMYELDLVPAGHHAYRPEDFILDANTMFSGATFRDFLRNLSKAMKHAKEGRTQYQLLRNYEFFAPKMLLDSPFDMAAFQSANQFLFAPSVGDPTHGISTGNNMDLLTIIKGAISNTLVAQELFIADQNNEMFKVPRIHFTVRFNTIYGSSDGAVTVDPGLNDYKEITHQYLIEPYITFKHGAVSQETMDIYVAPTSQLDRIREMVRMGMIRRIYNYIYTEENTEVIDFDIKLKTFYYNSLNLSKDTASRRSNYASSPDVAIGENMVINDIFRVRDNTTNTSDAYQDSIMNRLFGQSSPNGSNCSADRTGADRLGGGFNETPTSQLYGDVTGDTVMQRRNEYETHMADYLREDLLALEGMKVRGDPVWLLSPYANMDIGTYQNITSSEGIAELSPTNSIQVRARSGQVIFLRMHAPAQQDLMDPNRDNATSCPSIIGGFYQITLVTSEFVNGNFTQSLDGIKLNHLNYAEELLNQGMSGPPSPFGDAIESNVADFVSAIENVL